MINNLKNVLSVSFCGMSMALIHSFLLPLHENKERHIENEAIQE